jgi:hypothetical protein
MKNSKISRRKFIGAVAAGGALAKIGVGQKAKTSSKIDRFALVSRHNPVLRKTEPLSPLSVGNGEFAFTCDVTGLQTFSDEYKDAMPLCTMSNWGWHTKPMPPELQGKTYQLTDYDTYGRKVGYQTGRAGQQELYDYLRENPHRLHLGQIGLRLLKADGSEAKSSDITDIEQKLDLWKGIIESRFKFEGKDVLVKTAVHPTLDILAVSVESPLVIEGKLSVRIAFPYGSQTMQAADWSQPEKHESKFLSRLSTRAEIQRNLDNDKYFVALEWSEGARIEPEKPHHFIFKSSGARNLEFVVSFSQTVPLENLPTAAQTFTASETFWKNFWTKGAAIELAETKDKRAPELERRIVLSQYLTAINCSGSLPPQETGLTCNSWYGKFHLEMHWWHAAHFALWNRVEMFEKSLDWYTRVLPSARERAKQQGYAGARWAKMTDATGRDSPSPIGPLLIWQQPHPIFYAELVYLNKPTGATLRKFKQIVEETAEFMASFAHFDAKNNRYVLGPPVIPAQENHPAKETWNPTFELEYWHFGLKKANEWRERLGLRRNPKWDDVLGKLSPLPAKDGVYLAHENCPQTYTERNIDHPSMLAAYGILAGEKVDKETMRRTLAKVMKEWNWDDTWGWDYPMTAMTAARLGETATAIDALLLETPKNHYAANGHNYQRPNLPLYLPGNGGLLYAIALMANGWKEAPKQNAPGFPKDWKVKAEGFNAQIFQKI